MAYGKIKTEAGNKNGKGRWCTRNEAKKASKKARRNYDKKESNDR